MAKKEEVYTYRSGKKLKLRKRVNQYVVRRLPRALSEAGVQDAEQMSSASARVTCKPDELETAMTSARHLAPTHHAYEVEDTGNEFLITDRLIVTFQKPLSVDELGKFAGRFALEIVSRLSDRKYILRLTDATGLNPVKLAVKLMEGEKKLVANVEHDLNMRFTKCLDLPTDPSYINQWHLHRHRQPSSEYDPRSSARCESAWLLLNGFGSADVVIGVTDDGCQLDHPDFDSEGKFAGWGYLQQSILVKRGDAGADPTKMYEVDANHGTSCAGVIAAEIDGEMTVGAAPDCRLLPIKWQSSGPYLLISDTKMLTVLDYVADKIDVLSNSWGGAPVSTWSQDVVDRIAELAGSGGRRGRGIVFLWAAGNENCPISHVSTVNIPYTSGWMKMPSGNWQWVGVESAKVFRNNLVGVPGVMHVAALASTAQRSHYSNYGTGIGICAPTSNMHEYSRLDLPGLGVTTATGEGIQITASFGGTSSATPLAAGIAGLVISANPELSALETISILKQTASKDLNLAGYPSTPPAAYDPNPTWDVSPIAPFDHGDFTNEHDPDGTWSPWFGHGCIDAAGAVSRARELANDRTIFVRIERSDNLAIPDLDPAGVTSRVFIEQNGNIRNLQVRVDITHTYIGDLQVRLIAPDGQIADLHRRSGGRTQNLVRTFDESTTPALVDLHGRDIHGIWSLEVSDQARFDRGTLNRWILEAEILADGAIRAESAPGTSIPDNTPSGITDSITINESRDIERISATVDVTHTWIGDLRIHLIGPRGDDVVLHNRTDGSADNIQHTYDPANVPALGRFLGQPARGTWSLKVSDHAGRDIGKLNRWALTIS